jgi:hypothetical protein
MINLTYLAKSEKKSYLVENNLNYTIIKQLKKENTPYCKTSELSIEDFMPLPSFPNFPYNRR